MRIAVCLSLVLAGSVAGCGRDAVGGGAASPSAPASSASAEPNEPIAVGERVPSFVLDRLDAPGKVRVPEAKLTVLDFFGTFCGNSRFWFRAVEAMQQRHRAEGLAVVGVSQDDDSKGVIEFARENGTTFPIVWDGADHHLAKTVRPANWQAIVVVDRDGVVRHVHHGTRPGDDEKMEAELVKILASMK